jgi:hypothetical protein
MAGEQKVAYPDFAKGTWWILRKKWRQTLPSIVTPTLLAISLETQERSARLNVYNPLLKLGLIDKDGRTTERANAWREDDTYPAVCRQIRQEIYPEELITLAPGPAVKMAEVERWFRLHAGVGDNAAHKMGVLYELLSSADPTQAPDDNKTTTVKGQAKQQKPNGKQPSASAIKATLPNGDGQKAVAPKTDHTNPLPSDFPQQPSVHIDIQIHISPDASSEQIDQVFASMSKHLYPPR